MIAADGNKPTRTQRAHPPAPTPPSLMWHVSVPKHTSPICVMITQTRGVSVIRVGLFMGVRGRQGYTLLPHHHSL